MSVLHFLESCFHVLPNKKMDPGLSSKIASNKVKVSFPSFPIWGNFHLLTKMYWIATRKHKYEPALLPLEVPLPCFSETSYQGRSQFTQRAVGIQDPSCLSLSFPLSIFPAALLGWCSCPDIHLALLSFLSGFPYSALSTGTTFLSLTSLGSADSPAQTSSTLWTIQWA